ncbi:MAG TPA: hypothetical protein VFI37_02675 [Gaiellaceae bacterium]|nr:hypothetical protein [Gaiellaceae bacterium]
MKQLSIVLAAVAALALAATAAAGTGVTTSGGTTVSGGVATLVSNTGDTATANDASSITVALPAGTTFADLTTLSTDFDVTDDNCAGGSPRFSIALDDGKNVFVYLGPAPGFNACAQNVWQSSGNLIDDIDACRWDTSQEIAGTQCTTHAAALVALGSKSVVSVSLVVDGGWAFPDKEQTVLAKNIRVNDTVFPSTAQQPGAATSPAQACRAERAAIGADAFRDEWGTNKTKANAFGKCVSAHAHAKHAKAKDAKHGHANHGHAEKQH